MSDDLREVEKLITETLGALKRVSNAVTADKEEAIAFQQRVVKMVTLTQRITDGHSQSIQSLESLVMALIEELAASKGVDPAHVASRHLAHIQKHPSLYRDATVAHQKAVANHLSHPGFPDDVPLARGGFPTLIVDNDNPET